MKRLICIVLIVAICIGIAVPCGATTRKELDETIKTYAIDFMRQYKDIYDSDPNKFPDEYVISMYEYYNLYQAANGLCMAENAISGMDSVSSYKTVEIGDIKLYSILNDAWSKWMNGESDRTEALDILVIFVESVLAVQDAKNK